MAMALAKGERTRAKLLEIAVRRFAAEGFRRTSVASVAREAGLTPAAVYAYFPGKEALFEAAVDADAAALIESSLELLGPDGLASTYPLLLPAISTGLENHPLARRVLAGKEPEVINRLLSLPALLDLRKRCAQVIRAAQASGRMRKDVDPDQMSVGMETTMLALLMGSLQVGEVDDERSAGVLAVLDAALRPSS